MPAKRKPQPDQSKRALRSAIQLVGWIEASQSSFEIAGFGWGVARERALETLLRRLLRRRGAALDATAFEASLARVLQRPPISRREFSRMVFGRRPWAPGGFERLCQVLFPELRRALAGLDLVLIQSGFGLSDSDLDVTFQGLDLARVEAGRLRRLDGLSLAHRAGLGPSGLEPSEHLPGCHHLDFGQFTDVPRLAQALSAELAPERIQGRRSWQRRMTALAPKEQPPRSPRRSLGRLRT